MIATEPWLFVLSGKPGTGKTTLAKALVHRTGAVYLRVDAVETALAGVRAQVGADGYVVAHAIAGSNLLLGNPVIVDAVNPVHEARVGWRATAEQCGAHLVMVETVLIDLAEHRRRVEQRRPDIPGHQVPTWTQVLEGAWQPWDEARDGARVVIETTDSAQALAAAAQLIPWAEL